MIDAVAERGGGRVVVTKGVHRVGGLLMRSNVELHLEDGTPMKLLSFHYQCKVTPRYPTGCMLCGVAFECVDGFRIENVVLKDIDIVVTGAGEEASRTALETPVPYKFDAYPTPDIFWPHIFPAYGLYVDRADNVRLENVHFRLADGTKDLRPKFAGIRHTLC